MSGSTPPRSRSTNNLGGPSGIAPVATPPGRPSYGHAHRDSTGSGGSGTPGAGTSQPQQPFGRFKTASPAITSPFASGLANLQSPDSPSPSSSGILQRRSPFAADAPRGRGLVVEFDAPGVTALSVSPDKDSAALASREGLFIFNLDQPREAPSWVRNPGESGMMDIQWNPHTVRKEWIAATTDRQLAIWNLSPDMATSTAPPSRRQRGSHAARNILRVFPGHSRTITDLDWSPHNPDLIATAGFDSWIHIWDMRVPYTAAPLPPLPDQNLDPNSKPRGNSVSSFCPFSHGAPLVFFAPHDPNILATSHHTDLHIWDLRKPFSAEALHTVRKAHELEIRGINFSRSSNPRLVSCGQDRTIRIWDVSGEPKMIEGRGLEYAAWKCRWTPEGEGFVILPFGNDRTSLYLYPRKEEGSGAPLMAFAGHDEAILDFVYRKRGDGFEIVSWGLDETLRVWEVPKSTMDVLCGCTKEDEAQAEAEMDTLFTAESTEIVEHFRAECLERNPAPPDEDDDEVAWLREAFGDSDSEEEAPVELTTTRRPTFPTRSTVATTLAAEIEHLRKIFPAVRIMETSTDKITVYAPTSRIPDGLFLAEIALPPSSQVEIDLGKTPGWNNLAPNRRRMLEATCRGLSKYYGRTRTGCLEGLVKFLGSGGPAHEPETSDGEPETPTIEVPRQEERYVPFPRLSQGVFCPGAAGDKLVVFGSPIVGRMMQGHPRDFGGYTVLRGELLREFGAPMLEASSTVSNASSDEESSFAGRRRTRRRRRQHRPPQLASGSGFPAPFLARETSPLVPNLLSRMSRYASTTKELALLSASRLKGRGSRRASIPDGALALMPARPALDGLEAEPPSMGTETASSSPPQRKLGDIRSPAAELATDPSLRAAVFMTPVKMAAGASEATAKLAKMSGASPLALCLHNQGIALAKNDGEAARMWALAGTLLARCLPGGIMRTSEGEHVALDEAGLLRVDERVDEGVDLHDDGSSIYSEDFPLLARKRYSYWTRVAWRSHPLARQLVANALQALFRCRDVQTLTMLVCVLSEKLEEDDPNADMRHLEAANKDFDNRFKKLSSKLQRIEHRLPLAGIQSPPKSTASPEPEGYPFPPSIHSPARAGSAASSTRSSMIEYPMTTSGTPEMGSKLATSPSLSSTLLSAFGGSTYVTEKGRTSPAPFGIPADGMPGTQMDIDHSSSAAIALPRRPIAHRSSSTIAQCHEN